MSKIAFSKLKLKLPIDTVEVVIGEGDSAITLEVKQYLPQNEKAELIQYVITNSLDDTTGCFSPIRLETYFSLAIAKWYGQITFTDKQLSDAAKTYDLLESNEVFDKIMCAIPSAEYKFLNAAVNDTANDIARFNNSFAGMITAMSGDASAMDSQLTEIFEKIKNKEGLEELSAIRDIMGRA